MIKTDCFQVAWIEGFRKQQLYAKVNPPLLEKMIHALSLLQHLKRKDLNFVFKGGTSLILLLEKPNRFSIDIDIVTKESRDTIEKILDKVVTDSHFRGWQLDEKRSYKAGVPKAHYEIEYTSNLNKGSNYILLNILFERTHYPALELRPILTDWIETVETIEVNIPTVEAITGDKLTAFAPTTTGILYGKGKELEIIKQLFDLGSLFDQVQSMEIVALSFASFAKQEITYRNLSIEPNDILRDIIETCRIICLRERNRTEPEKSRFLELQNGIRGFRNFLITGNFSIDDAVIASAKVAYLTAKLLHKDFSTPNKYHAQKTDELEIRNPHWSALNKLKRFSNQAAFFYWYKCLEILDHLQ